MNITMVMHILRVKLTILALLIIFVMHWKDLQNLSVTLIYIIQVPPGILRGGIPIGESMLRTCLTEMTL